MDTDLPESNRSTPESASEVSWHSQNESYNEVSYGTATSTYLQEHDEEGEDSEPQNFIIHSSHQTATEYQHSSPVYVHVTEVVGSSDSYGQVALQAYSVDEGQHYVQSPTDSNDESDKYKYNPDDGELRQEHAIRPASQARGSHAQSPAPSTDSKPVSPQPSKSNIMILQNDGVDSQGMDSSDQELDHVPADQHIILNHSSSLTEQNVRSLTVPVLLDRNNLITFIATSRSDSPLALSSHSLGPRSHLPTGEQYLNRNSTSVSLSQTILAPVLAQRDLLPSIISSTSSHGTAFPINHKQMLAQKYAAELEAPSTSNSLPADMRTQMLRLERLSNRVVSSPYSVSSSASNLTSSQSVSMYVAHHSDSSITQTVPLDVYAIDRGVALVSSTRDSPDELIEHYPSPVHHSTTHSSVHGYVTSSVDLVPSTVNHSISSNVDSTVGSKLCAQEEIVDSSDRYSEHVDTSDGILHSTTQGYSQSLDDLGSSEDGASSTVTCTSVLSGAAAIDSGDSEHIFSESNQLTNLDNLACCGTVSSATDPDSTRLSLMDRADLIVLPGSSEHVENMRPRRDLRNKHWCEDCCHFYDKECTRHKIQLIFDKPVLSRAWASLPATYLYVNRVTTKKDDAVYGVFAKKTIPKRTQFGPIEGVLVKCNELPKDNFLLLVDKEHGMLVYLDTTDESISNWMRFVRPAKNYKEQNLVLVQQGQCLYFNTTKAVNPKTELRVWYSPAYAERWKLNLLELDDEEKRAMEDEEFLI